MCNGLGKRVFTSSCKGLFFGQFRSLHVARCSAFDYDSGPGLVLLFNTFSNSLEVIDKVV